MTGPDLFTAALDARDREIERLRAALAEAEVALANRPHVSARSHQPDRGAEIVAFPAEARVGHIRRTVDAARLVRRHETLNDRFSDAANTWAAQLRKRGLSAEVADAEADAMFAALWAEWRRRGNAAPAATGGPTDAA